MWNAKGSCTTVTETFLKYKISTAEGQSGSPIIIRKGEKEFIVGVHIGSNESRTRNIAVRLTAEKKERINKWVKEIVEEIGLSKLTFIKMSVNLRMKESNI